MKQKAEKKNGGQNISSLVDELRKKYLTRDELAVVLKISLRKVDQMIADREIPVVRFGTVVRFRLEDVEEKIRGRGEEHGARSGDGGRGKEVSSQRTVVSSQRSVIRDR